MQNRKTSYNPCSTSKWLHQTNYQVTLVQGVKEGMYKNQLQELAQRSCFNLPSYTCTREGPDHAPRFQASVNFNGETFQGPGHCTTLRQAEHAAAEVALNILSARVPSRLLAARVLDEIGVYKNLLQESAHKAGLTLPVYSTERSGPAHLPVFISTVELAGMNFTGEAARTKKQAEKNAAMSAWSALKQLTNASDKGSESSEEQEHLVVAKVLSNFKPKGENRAVRQSVPSQQERSSCRESHFGSTTKELLHRHQWKPMTLLSDFSKEQQCCLLPQASLKIIPPTSSNCGMQKEISPPLDEHQKDEDEWLNGGVKHIKFNVPVPQFVHRRFNSKRPSQTYQNTESLLIRTAPAAYGRNSSSIAPAVHIRSVIPVCSAPPRPKSPPSSNSPVPAAALRKKEEEESSSVLGSSVLEETKQEAPLPAASSKLNNLHL